MASFDPRDACAVLIGIDEYPSGLGPSLSGPVDDAVRFARFFVSQGVPPDRITLLLGTRVGSVDAPAGVVVRPADRTTIRDVFLAELPARTASGLYVVWGGHGFVDTGRRRRLRYADARAAELGDLDLDSLLTTFASDLVPGLNQQVWLVDACQVHESTAFGHETFRHGEPVAGRVQDVLFAAGVGQAAANLRVRRTGVFSREVLRVLESAGVERLAQPEQLITALRDRFMALRADGLTQQTPTYLWYRNLLGDEGMVLSRPSGPQPVPTRAEPSPRALAPAVNALTEIPEFRRPQDREEILSLLRNQVYGAIRRSPSTRLDAFAIVRTCLRYPGGLTELVEAVRFFVRDDSAMERFAKATARLKHPDDGRYDCEE